MEMEACQKIDLEFEANGLIDGEQFSGGLITEKEGDDSLLIRETDLLPELRESTEPQENQKNGRYNLRKSLAWDSAFFTSAGVLDAEELSTMMTGADKGEKQMLPGIQEEITGSTESLSTLGSDTLTMETLEEDLFVDIRASIQRSSKKALNSRISSSKAAAVEVDSAAISSLKKEDTISGNMSQKPSVKKKDSLQTVRTSIRQPKESIGKLAIGKATKQDSVHSQAKQMSMAKIGGKSFMSLPKPPKTISSSIPSSTVAGKRDSVGTGRAKSGISNPIKLFKILNFLYPSQFIYHITISVTHSVIYLTAAVPCQETQPPKISSLGARRALPKPAPSSSSSLLSSSTTNSVQSRRSSTSSDGSSNISSKINPAKSNIMPPRRNMGKTSNINTGPSGSIPKTPSRVISKNKLPSSLSKICSSVSPASSIGEWSSASSTSSSMINQKFSNSRNSIDTSSCRSADDDLIPLDTTNPSVGQTADGAILTSDNSKKSTTQNGDKLRAPGKPSGLRMPSHKFGFFDGVKSSVNSPNRLQQSPSAVNNKLPRNGPSTGVPVRSSYSKLKTAKISTPKIVTLKKPISPAPSPDKKSTDVKNSPNSSVGVKVNIASEETCQDPKITQNKDRVEQVFANTGNAIIEESLGGTKIEAGDLVAKENDLKGSKDEHLSSDASENAVIISESETCRVPLAPKNSFVSSESVDVAKESVVEKSGFILPNFEQKENS
ncbi:hypothetical protein STAS_20332 [Striga asiatica]|uniref:Uncharacterized protein n=1 Tax=Striga asiatica TaxID=4170 RepID=A0A5A7QEV7_STRAF|nr:hypothetical protein STAS_20332 [Striga asiatica]